MTGRFEAAREVLMGALDDLIERRDRGEVLSDLVVLAVTSDGDSSDHFHNGLSVAVTQRVGTLRWFTLRAEESLREEWRGDAP